MDKIVLYLVEASVLLICLYALYALILRKETFFSLNRFFLIGIVLFSLAFPLLSFDFNSAKVAVVQQPIEEISKVRISYYDAFEEWTYGNYEAFSDHKNGGLLSFDISEINWTQLFLKVLLGVYFIGIVVSLSRTIWTVQWLYKLIRNNPKEHKDNIVIVKLPNPIAPFSFLKYVFIHQEMINSDEFDHIMAHEKTHVKQRHSIDLIFVQFLAAFLWFNPVIWRLIKSLKTTHEYIADSKIINEGYSLVEYQTLLLRQLISNNSYGLVHNFNLSFIKKRIAMMKNKKSGWTGRIRVATVLIITVLVSGFIMQCNSELDEQSAEASWSSADSELISDVNLPVLPDLEFKFKGDMNNTMEFTIANNELIIDGELTNVDDIVSKIESSNLTDQATIILNVDASQTMKMMRDVQMEMRKANKRKLLYLGQTSGGAKVEIPFLLPPAPEADGSQAHFADIDALEKEGKIDPLRIDLGHTTSSLKQEVYDFAMAHAHESSSDYVVVANYDNDDTYSKYIVNLVEIQEGFNQIYKERALQMFDKNFYDLNKEQFRAVRKGFPMAISVSDRI